MPPHGMGNGLANRSPPRLMLVMSKTIVSEGTTHAVILENRTLDPVVYGNPDAHFSNVDQITRVSPLHTTSTITHEPTSLSLKHPSWPHYLSHHSHYVNHLSQYLNHHSQPFPPHHLNHHSRPILHTTSTVVHRPLHNISIITHVHNTSTISHLHTT